MLKGRDLLVAHAAFEAGLGVYLIPFVSHDCARDGVGDYDLAKFHTKKRVPRRVDDDKIEKFFKFNKQAQPSEVADVWAINVDEDSVSEKLGNWCEWSAAGYFGNEASHIDFYVQVALLVEFPDKVAQEITKKVEKDLNNAAPTK